MPAGDVVAIFSLATVDIWRDKQTGEQRKKTEWHRIILYGKLAEVAGECQCKWLGQSSGQDRYATEGVVSINGTWRMLEGSSCGTATHLLIRYRETTLLRLSYLTVRLVYRWILKMKFRYNMIINQYVTYVF